MALNRASKKDFIDGLLDIAAEAFGLNDAEEVVSNGEQLRRQIWKTALGYEDKTKGDDGVVRTVKHPPAAWAQQFLYNVIVGKPAPMTADAAPGMKAAAKVRELSKDRLNALAAALTKPAGPPKYKAKGDEK